MSNTIKAIDYLTAIEDKCKAFQFVLVDGEELCATDYYRECKDTMDKFGTCNIQVLDDLHMLEWIK